MSEYFDEVQRKAREAKEASQKNKVAEQQAAASKVHQAIKAASDWIRTVVYPVLEEANNSLEKNGGKVTSKSTAPNRIDITVSTGSKNRVVSYAVGEDGVIHQTFSGRLPQQIGKVSDSDSGGKVRASIAQIITDLISS